MIWSTFGQNSYMKTQAETPRVPEETVCVPWEVLTASAEHALQNKNYSEAETMALSALEEAESFDISDGRLAMTLESLAEIYYLQQKYTLAAPICRRLLSMYSKTLGEDHLDTGIISHNLAMIYHSAGKLVQAEPLYQAGSSNQNKSDGSEAPTGADLARSLYDIALSNQSRTRSRSAASLGYCDFIRSLFAFRPLEAI